VSVRVRACVRVYGFICSLLVEVCLDSNAKTRKLKPRPAASKEWERGADDTSNNKTQSKAGAHRSQKDANRV
jgi:hypothetical protein